MVKVLGNPDQPEPAVALHYTCSATDTFETVWRSVFGDLFVTLRTPGFGFAGEPASTHVPSTEISTSTVRCLRTRFDVAFSRSHGRLRW